MRDLVAIITLGGFVTTSGVALATEARRERVDPMQSGVLPAGEGGEDPTLDEPEAEVERESRRTAKNSVYLELAGPGLAYSLNYDRVIADEFSARIGFSYLSVGASAESGDTTASAEASYWAVPITANYLGISSGTHTLELGAGGSVISASGDVGVGVDSAEGSVTTFALTGIAGYRRQALNGGFNFRVGASPMMFLEGTFLTWGYLSLGASF